MSIIKHLLIFAAFIIAAICIYQIADIPEADFIQLPVNYNVSFADVGNAAFVNETWLFRRDEIQ